MKKVIPLFLTAILLSSCKTSELYKRNAYNSPIFDENYYTVFDDNAIVKFNEDKISAEPTNFKSVSVLSNDNLGLKNNKFNYGILSKLYDGRVVCGGLYQLSRVQLNKTGFGTNLPSMIESASYFEFAARGGSSFETPLNADLKFNIEISVIARGNLYKYSLNEVMLPVDKGGATTIVHFDFQKQLDNISYYQMKFSCLELPENATDDYTNKEKEHLSMMLYEVLIS